MSKIIKSLLFSLLFQSCNNVNIRENIVLLNLDSNITKTDIILNIKSDKKIYQLGEKPKIEVRLINKSNKTLNFFTSLDGSSDSLRYPYAGFKIFRNDSLLKHHYLISCGNMDGISKKCFFSVKRNQFFDPQNQAPWVYQDKIINDSMTFSNIGKYQVMYFYSTNQDTLSGWLGWNVDFEFRTSNKNYQDSLITYYKKWFKDMPQIELQSDTLEFEIK